MIGLKYLGWRITAYIFAASVFFPNVSVAQRQQEARFALIIGVNQAVDKGLAKLNYADDDAARYFDLFRHLGIRSYLHAHIDTNTQRLHKEAALAAHAPTLAALQGSVAVLHADIQAAKNRGARATLYFVYAGHGNVKGEEGYLALEDARLSGQTIKREIIERAAADQVHMIMDACYSFYLAYGRGPGGSRRSMQGFSALGRTFDSNRVGFLIASGTKQISNE